MSSSYRGGWCPYCNLELRAYAQRSSEFEEAGARVVAISPQTPDASLTLVERAELPFTVLSDVGNVVAARFGLVHPVQSDLAAVYAMSEDYTVRADPEAVLATAVTLG